MEKVKKTEEGHIDQEALKEVLENAQNFEAEMNSEDPMEQALRKVQCDSPIYPTLFRQSEIAKLVDARKVRPGPGRIFGQVINDGQYVKTAGGVDFNGFDHKNCRYMRFITGDPSALKELKEKHSIDLFPGDLVMFRVKSGDDMILNGTDHAMVMPFDITGVVNF